MRQHLSCHIHAGCWSGNRGQQNLAAGCWRRQGLPTCCNLPRSMASGASQAFLLDACCDVTSHVEWPHATKLYAQCTGGAMQAAHMDFCSAALCHLHWRCLPCTGFSSLGCDSLTRYSKRPRKM